MRDMDFTLTDQAEGKGGADAGVGTQLVELRDADVGRMDRGRKVGVAGRRQFLHGPVISSTANWAASSPPGRPPTPSATP